MRIALGQINSSLGDFVGNKNKILEFSRRALEKKCELIVFPEAALFGYHPFDLLERQQLVKQQLKQLDLLSKEVPAGIAILVGVFTFNSKKMGRPYHNSAALLVRGKKPKYFHKQLLPTGDVFDEARFIEKGDLRNNFFSLNGRKFFLTICEDIWAWPDKKGTSIYRENPLTQIKGKVDCVINMSASPFFEGKLKLREYCVEKTARQFKAPMIYVNLVGAQDELIFDGNSFAMNRAGKKVVNCAEFDEDLSYLDLKDLSGGSRPTIPGSAERLQRALVLGIRDFCRKSGLTHAHLGLSGGIDSALVACLAADALGPNNVTAIAMPGPFSAQESLDLAKELAVNLGIGFKTVDINKGYETIINQVSDGFDIKEFGVVNENLQARIRGMILMAYSNKKSSLLLNTSNKDEFSCGYSTLYGDMCGGLSPLGDLLKGQIYDLAKFYNKQRTVIPKWIIDRPPTAELRPNQKDQDSLPPYDQLDQAVRNIVENSGAGKNKVEKWLLPILMKSEFKRWQAPPILKVSKHSFGRGRRYPIANLAKE